MTNRRRKTDNVIMTQESLSPTEVQFLRSFDVLQDAVHITDNTGRILYVNSAMEELTGYKKEEVLGKQAKELWGGNMSEDFYKDFYNNMRDVALGDEKVFKVNVLNKKKDGTEFWKELHISPVLDRNGEPQFYVHLQADVTQQMNRAFYLEKFVSIVGHQTKTSLSSILLSLDYALKEHKMNKSLREDLQEALDQTLELRDTINNLLAVSQAGKLDNIYEGMETEDTVRLNELLTSVIQRVARDHPEVAIHARKSKNDYNIKTNKGLAEEALANIVYNAAEYTKPKNGSVKLSIRKENKCLVITCKDNGIGIPKSEQKKIFNQFFRASNARKVKNEGTGLGMHTAKLIGAMLGWKIVFESEEGKGTTFRIKIPNAQ